MIRSRSLKAAAWLFVASWCVHTADHARRGLAASPEGVIWTGTFAALMACVAVTLIVSGHSSAPVVAAMVFPAIAFGVLATHIPPDWGPLSDPIVVGGNTDLWSVPAVLVEVVAAAWVGVVALGVLRRHSFAMQVPETEWALSPS